MIIIFITTLIGSNGIFYAIQDHTCAIDFTYTIVLHAETTLSRRRSYGLHVHVISYVAIYF